MRKRSERRCLIAAGGTAGHVLPALAIAEELTARGVRVSFAGPPRPEQRLLLDAGYEVDEFDVRGIPRDFGAATLKALGVAVKAPVECAAILRRREPDVVLGAGGYAAGPMVTAAWLRRIPAALTEADAHLGLANRLAAPFARRVFLAYPLPGRSGGKYRVVGRPVPRRSSLPAGGQAEARRRFELPEEGPVVLVVGGSQGARRLNEAAVEAFDAGGGTAPGAPGVLHLAGERDYAALAPRVTRPGYRLLAFTDEFGDALGACDLVVSRSGGVVWEIAAAGKPALLVPYPHATADHQTKNARHFERAGGALAVPEGELDLRRQAQELLADPARLASMGAAMRAAARPGAAAAVAEELIALAAAGQGETAAEPGRERAG
jgi:UDP-N-acetylglucosamine--N-acetylmuramyl-(pentapeptide) pyrophosphoryl-undecaprenol N-acetylglucosamine transferase